MALDRDWAAAASGRRRWCFIWMTRRGRGNRAPVEGPAGGVEGRKGEEESGQQRPEEGLVTAAVPAVASASH